LIHHPSSAMLYPSYMELKVEKIKLRDTKVKLIIEFSQAVFAEYEEKAITKLAQALELKGFRKGRVPVSLAKEHLSKEKIAQQALGLALPEVYGQAVMKAKISPIGPPQIKIRVFKPKKPILLEAEVETLPKIELPNFKEIKVKKEPAKLTEKELEEGLDTLRKRLAEYKDKKGPAAKGDWVEITFEGSIKGAKIEQLSSKNHPFLLGQGGFVKGFEDQIEGMKKGEEKKINLVLPKKHPNKTLAGQKVDFIITLNRVKKVIIRPLKELAKKLGAKDEADFKKRFKKAQELEKKKAIEQKFEQRLVAEVINKAKLELPESLVAQEFQRITERHQAELKQQQMTPKEYLTRFNIDQKELDKKLDQTARENVKVALVMAEVGRKEKIEATEAEIKKRTNQMISQGMVEGGDKNELRNQYQSEKGQRFIANIIRNEKTLKRLKKLVQE